MKKQFEELEVWQISFALGKELGAIFYNKDFKNYGFQDQIMRAVISISNNIAEGNSAGGTKQFIKYLYIAKGSASEVKNMIYFSQHFGYIADEKIKDFCSRLDTLSTKLTNFIAYLKTKAI